MNEIVPFYLAIELHSDLGGFWGYEYMQPSSTMFCDNNLR